MLHFWGPQLMGEWLVITAIPTYFSYSDLGFSDVAVREITVLAGANKLDEALNVYRSGSFFLAILAALLLGPLLLLSQLPLQSWFNLEILSNHDAFMVLTCAVFGVICWFQITLVSGSFTATGRYGEGFSILAVILLLNQIFFWLTLALGGGPMAGASVLLAGKLVGIAVYSARARRVAPWLSFGLSGISFRIVRRLIVPSIASFGYTLNQSMTVQGARLFISIALGPQMVTVYSTLRTFTGLIFQATSALQLVIGPEIAKAFGRGDIPTLKKIHRRSCQLTLWFTCTASIAMFISGSFIVRNWTNGKVTVDTTLLSFLLTLACLNAFWGTSFRLELEANRHVGLVKKLAPLGILASLTGFWLMDFTQSILPFVGCLLLVDAIMTWLVARESLSITKDSPVIFLKAMLIPPVFLLNHLPGLKFKPAKSR